MMTGLASLEVLAVLITLTNTGARGVFGTSGILLTPGGGPMIVTGNPSPLAGEVIWPLPAARVGDGQRGSPGGAVPIGAGSANSCR